MLFNVKEAFINTYKENNFKVVNLPITYKDNYVKALHHSLVLYQIVTSRFWTLIEVLDKDNKCLIHKKYFKKISYGLIEIVEKYLDGFPADSYFLFESLMNEYIENTNINLYVKENKGNLYRARKIEEDKMLTRMDIFHVPLNLRSVVSTNRFSIPGWPALYLCDSLQLCEYEIGKDNQNIYSLFKLNRKKYEMNVFDISMSYNDVLSLLDLNDDYEYQLGVVLSFFARMPFQIACSFVRNKPKAPFAVEYIIPQIVMQWIRKQNKDTENVLIGIKYKSSANKDAYKLGNNYVFPIANPFINGVYSELLAKSFVLTLPIKKSCYHNLYDVESQLSLMETKSIFEELDK